MKRGKCCNGCDAQFRTFGQLSEHIKLNHETGVRFLHQYGKDKEKDLETDNYDCEQCDLSFDAKFKLTRHVRSIHYLQKFTCNKCEKKYTRSNDLLKHELIAHSAKAPEFKCDLCDTVFNKKSNLERHSKSSFSRDIDGAYKNMCGECNLCFCSGKDFRQHMKTHQVSSFSCEVCDDKFTLKGSLEYHQLSRTLMSCVECKKTLCNKYSRDCGWPRRP